MSGQTLALRSHETIQRRKLWACAALLSAGVALVALPAQAEQQPRFWTELRSKQEAIPGPDARTFSPLVDRASKAVINIDVRYGDKKGGKGGSGQGSGFLITQDGYALTNNHVIENAREITVTLADDRRYSATIVGADESTDVALIKLHDAGSLRVLPLGNSEDMAVGDWVVAIGSPLGLRSTVTAGIVSATGRRDVKPGNRRFYSNFIQTDASINPGNSGGPLLNTKGEVIGINTAINREGQGIGFAIPVNMIKTILPALRSKGYVERSWMGIKIQELDGGLARSFGLKQARGALVTDIVGNSPGSRAGLKSGDVILDFDRTDIDSSSELPWLASVAGVGRTVPITVWRQGKRRKMSLTLEAQPGQAKPPAAKVAVVRKSLKVKEDLGIVARDLPRGQKDKGALVVRIDASSPARASGLQPGDVVVQVNGADIDNQAGFYKALKEGRKVVRVKVRRNRSSFFFAFSP